MHLRGIGYAFAGSLFFGLGAVLVRLLGKEIDATVVAFLNLSISGSLITAGLVLTGNTRPFKALRSFTRPDWVDLFLLACPGTSLSLLVIVAGFARTSALVGGFVLQFNGLAGLLFAVILLRERIGGPKQAVGILLLLIGGLLVVLKGTQSISWESGGLGDILVLLGSIGIGFSFIPAKRLSTRIDTMPLVAIRLLVGACTLLPILAFQLIVGVHNIQWQPSLTTLWVILPAYIITNFCLGYLVQQEGLRFIKAWEMSAISQSVPLFATAFALLLLRDSITPIQAIGGLLAILGGLIVSLNNGTETAVSAPVAQKINPPARRDAGG